MESSGGISGYIDVAQVVLYLFWIFFAGLIYYLHRENKREGYPLDSDRTTRSGGRVEVVGFPRPPKPKTYKLPHSGTVSVPNAKRDTRPIAGTPTAPFWGAPIEPFGDPLLAGVGPGAYAQRSDTPDLTYDGQPKIVPLRMATDFSLGAGDVDPRGMAVFGADGKQGGVVREVWVDRAECILRYLELDTAADPVGTILLPVTFAHISRRGVQVTAILSGQFANVPRLKESDRVTLLEEERVCAYYGAGTLYATPGRRESRL
jgi:photosynthetic reaction center H subunit